MSDHSTPIVLSKLKDGVKTISFNIPKKKNPIKPKTMELLLEAIEASKNDKTKIIVLKGEGGNFCSGAMLEPSMMEDFDVTDYLSKKVNPVVLAMRETHIPIIAQVEGFCVGLGFSLALACDMLIASENAKFSQIFTRIGLSSDGGGSYFLTKLLGHQKAFELIATNKNITAQEASELGIANHIIPESEIEAKTMEFAHNLANGPLVAIAQVKANIRASETGTLAEALETEAINQGKCFKTSDFTEGVSAFMMKREANFKGK